MSKKKNQPAATENETPIVEPELEPGCEAAEQKEPARDEAAEQSYTLTAAEFDAAKKHIESLQKERDDTVSLLQRNQADFDNYRRRNAAIRADSYEEGRRDSIKALLPVLDNFDRALADESTGGESFREGVKLIHKQLMETLAKEGLSEIEATGKFDPNLHEAVLQEKAEGKETGDILLVLQKGYKVGEKIIRHSMVKVAE